MSARDMSEELVAIKAFPLVAQGDYEAICAALMQSERGRWFLQEYAQRNRSADTKQLLEAIGRIEAVVCEDRPQPQQNFRSDLLEMAKAITQTRAEVAEMEPDDTAPSTAASAAAGPASGTRPGDVFAAAERIRDVTWAMRGHGFDPATCDQLEELAASILSASALRDPADHRASKLAEVLQYLERRIGSLLESCEGTEAAAQKPDHAPHANGHAPGVGPAAHRNGSATFVGPILEDDAIEVATAAPIRILALPTAVHDDLEGDWAPSPPVETRALMPARINGAGLTRPSGERRQHEQAAPPGLPSADSPTPNPEPMELPAPESAIPVAPAVDARSPAGVRLAETFAESAPSLARAPFSRAPAATPTEDPLAALKAMSEEELIALFS
jgi:hypothetical protein